MKIGRNDPCHCGSEKSLRTAMVGWMEKSNGRKWLFMGELLLQLFGLYSI